MEKWRGFSVDPDTGDYVFANGERLLRRGGSESLRKRLRLRIDESLMGQEASRERIRSRVLEAITADEDVERVMRLQIDRAASNRRLTIKFMASLRDGHIMVDEVEVGG